jgi:hypothetical protein
VVDDEWGDADDEVAEESATRGRDDAHDEQAEDVEPLPHANFDAGDCEGDDADAVEEPDQILEVEVHVRRVAGRAGRLAWGSAGASTISGSAPTAPLPSRLGLRSTVATGQSTILS